MGKEAWSDVAMNDDSELQPLAGKNNDKTEFNLQRVVRFRASTTQSLHCSSFRQGKRQVRAFLEYSESGIGLGP